MFSGGLLWKMVRVFLPESTVTASASKELLGASDKRHAFVCAFRVLNRRKVVRAVGVEPTRAV